VAAAASPALADTIAADARGRVARTWLVAYRCLDDTAKQLLHVMSRHAPAPVPLSVLEAALHALALPADARAAGDASLDAFDASIPDLPAWLASAVLHTSVAFLARSSIVAVRAGTCIMHAVVHAVVREHLASAALAADAPSRLADCPDAAVRGLSWCI